MNVNVQPSATVEPAYSGHLQFLENLSAIARCPLHRGLVFFRENTLINLNPTTGQLRFLAHKCKLHKTLKPCDYLIKLLS